LTFVNIFSLHDKQISTLVNGIKIIFTLGNPSPSAPFQFFHSYPSNPEP